MSIEHSAPQQRPIQSRVRCDILQHPGNKKGKTAPKAFASGRETRTTLTAAREFTLLQLCSRLPGVNFKCTANLSTFVNARFDQGQGTVSEFTSVGGRCSSAAAGCNRATRTSARAAARNENRTGVAGGLGQWFAFANPPLTAFAAPFGKVGGPLCGRGIFGRPRLLRILLPPNLCATRPSTACVPQRGLLPATQPAPDRTRCHQVGPGSVRSIAGFCCRQIFAPRDDPQLA